MGLLARVGNAILSYDVYVFMVLAMLLDPSGGVDPLGLLNAPMMGTPDPVSHQQGQYLNLFYRKIRHTEEQKREEETQGDVFSFDAFRAAIHDTLELKRVHGEIMMQSCLDT